MTVNIPIVQKIVVAGIIINDKNEILLLQRHHNEDILPNIWELPSGKKEALEPTQTALIREVKEETGLDIEIIRPISVFDYQITKPTEIRDSVQINFLVKLSPSDQTPKISSEHQSYAWINLSNIDNYPVSEEIKNVLQITKLHSHSV